MSTDAEANFGEIRGFFSLLNDLGKHLERYLESDDKKTLSEESCKLMEEVYSFWEEAYVDELKVERIVSEIVSTTPDILQILHDFMSRVLSALPVSDSNLSKAWVFAHGLVLGLSKHTIIAEVVVKRGLLHYHMKELRALRMSETDNWVVKSLLMSDLITLYNCASNCTIDAYYKEFSFSALLYPFLKASDNSMVIHAKMILAYVSSVLTDDEISETIKLSSSSADELIGILGKASTSGERRANGFTVTELAQGLTRLLVCNKNSYYLAKSALLASFVAIFSCGKVQEHIAACELLWSLLKNTKFKNELCKSDFPITEVLEQMKSSQDSNLDRVASCTLWNLTDTFERDLSTLTSYAEGCYQYGHFSECAELCSKYHEVDNDKCTHMLRLLLAKSVYHLYRRQAFHLQEMRDNQKIQRGKKYNLIHKECYDKARKVIDLLSTILDDSSIDAEGSKMLDMAMIDYSRETNKLNECKRCLLCRKSAKLCRSHIFPRGILEKFCSGITTDTKTKKVLTGFRNNTLQSPKCLTTFLLCLTCEAVLSRGGEEHFSSKFLDKVYDKCDPSSPASSHVIPYEGWFYHFCIGLVFRGIGQFFPHGYSNVDDMYKIFLQCRQYLLGNSPVNAETKLPLIAAIVNPTSTASDSPGFMNFALNYPLNESSSSLPLDGIIPTTAEQIYYFIIHFGIINVISLVEPSQVRHLQDRFFIHPEGGVLCIPEDKERADTVPRGVWNLFEQTAVEIETEHVRMSLSRLKFQEDNVLTEPAEEVVELFGFMPSFDKDTRDFGNVIKPASVVNVEKTLDFLPEGFQVNHRSQVNSVILPDDHKLIFHYTFTDGGGSGESVFLAVENHHQQRPYIIYHFYQPGLQMHVAFFVNSRNYEAEDFLLEKDPRIRVNDVERFTHFRKRIPELLPQLILSKGASSLSSLLRRTQIRKNMNYDRRCPTKEWCWYCKDLCDICMHNSGFGFTKPVVGREGVYKFCSEVCAIATGSKAVSPTIDFWDPSQNPPAKFSRTCALSDTHKELMYIFAEFTSANGYQIYDITLCKGDGTKQFSSEDIYAVCYHCCGINQLMFDFFLTKDLEFCGMVKLSEHEKPQEEFKVSACNTLQMIIKQALGHKGISSTSTFLKLYEAKGRMNKTPN